MTQRTKNIVIVKQNIIKSLTVVIVTLVLTQWSYPYLQQVGEAGIDAFFFLSIFPLGAMFGYFAFSYSNTNLYSAAHRTMADMATFIFLVVITFSVAVATIIGAASIPTLEGPFIVMASLLVAGCLVYDFWDLFSNLEK
jgi:hypothetical protein